MAFLNFPAFFANYSWRKEKHFHSNILRPERNDTLKGYSLLRYVVMHYGINLLMFRGTWWLNYVIDGTGSRDVSVNIFPNISRHLPDKRVTYVYCYENLKFLLICVLFFIIELLYFERIEPHIIIPDVLSAGYVVSRDGSVFSEEDALVRSVEKLEEITGKYYKGSYWNAI